MASAYRLISNAIAFTSVPAVIYFSNARFNVQAAIDFASNRNIDNVASASSKTLSYPFVPDRSEIRKFVGFLDMLPDHKKDILILGNEPKLRDDAFLRSKKVTCADTDVSKLRESRNEMRYKNLVSDDNEKLVECEALHMSEHPLLRDQQYDMIFSFDLQLNRLPFTQWEQYFDEILAHLKDDGFFVLKMMHKPLDHAFEDQTAERIVDDWQYSKHRNDVEYLFMELLMYLYHVNVTENDTPYVRCSDVLKLVEDRCVDREWDWTENQKETFLNAFKRLREHDLTLYCNEEDVVRSYLSNSKFYFQQVAYGNDNGSKYKYTPIFVLGKQTDRVGGQPRLFAFGDNNSHPLE
eukprot:CAMPEP_0202711004 /NCGR_PEP_ID=MMETSP1385-20130828/22884_1 /ASSEMBLY_ACC=CAM_ASM_000861 /TAXON_ID=933848 /ORGANISM="Elphidium margaritaceum" /LENGTH=350 /DNA_ID=CAMNT_0049370651 /DNA_START=29 /DNA_END=1081 /DNA_ORIENTATION=-